MPAAQSVAVGVWVCAGSVDESDEQAGLSHFVEHMLFKGTETRTAAEIAETIDAIGGNLDAFTDREHVCYYTRVLPEHTPIAMELLGDMVTHSRLDCPDIDVERMVVTDEILSCEDSPEEMIVDRFTETIWDSSPLGRNILGTVESVEQVNRDMLRAFMLQFYTPDRVVVSAAGSLEHSDLVRWVEAGLSGLMNGRKPDECAAAAALDLTPIVRPHHLLIDKDSERVYFCVGTKSYGQDAPDKVAAHLLDMILSGGCSSRLFQEIREKRGLVYSIGSCSACYRDAGFLAVSGSCGVEQLAEVGELINIELQDLKRRGVTAKELERAKEQARGNLLLASESTGDRMIRNTQNLVYFGRMVPVEEVLMKVQKVSLEDLHRVTNEILDDDLINVVGLGPFDESEANLNICVGGSN